MQVGHYSFLKISLLDYLQIYKLQKFDGRGSWESWWAHFQNRASYMYNKWDERDQLAFVKGALTENAAQVLWIQTQDHWFSEEANKDP